MAYTPQNINVFTAAYCGALAGMTTSGWVTDPTAADYSAITTVALQFAEEFDTLWGANQANLYQYDTIGQIVQAAWSQRTPPITAPFNTTPATFATLCNALIAIVNEGTTIQAGQGITPPTLGTNWASVIGVSGATLASPHTQTGDTNTGVIALSLTPQGSGIFYVSCKLAFSDGTTAGAITHSLVTLQGAAGNLLAGTGFLSQIKQSQFPGTATGGILNADAAGGNGITFAGASMSTGKVQSSDVAASLTGLLTANGAGGINEFTFSGLVDANGSNSATKLPFTVGLPMAIGVLLTNTAAHVITYGSAELFAWELPQ